MSRERRRRRTARLSPPPPAAAPRRRVPWAWIGAALGLVGVGVVVARFGFGLGRGPVAFPPPASAPPRAAVAFTDFVGAETCAPCHRPEYEAWRRSTHGRAGGAPTAERVIAPFDGRPMHFRDAVVTPSGTGSGKYRFTVEQRAWPTRVFSVDWVVGRAMMAGGGTQTFFSTFPDGTVRFLPFDFSPGLKAWVCNTNGRANRGVVPIGPDLPLAACGDWPPSRVLGHSQRFDSCQQCHGSQIVLQFDPRAHAYVTRFTTLAVNCESCHGPGRRHVELAHAGRLGAAADVGLPALDTLAKRRSLLVCFQCHALKEPLQPGYLPGDGLERHFALEFPEILDTLYFADGRTRGFAYQEGHLSSDCYRNGSMTCVDCHDPHSQHYRDIYDTALPGRFNDGQCLDCHPSKADRIAQHSHHAVGSPGSRCTGCHMPYLQEPGAGTRLRYARSDHTISIPRPAYDASLGIRDGCQQCHAERSAAALQATLTGWYGKTKPLPAAVTAALRADSAADRRTAARLLLADTSTDPVARFVGLSRFLVRFVTPDMPALEGETVQGLERLAAGPDRDLAALALATLHLARGDDRGVRRFLAHRLGALDSLGEAVRARWAWTLEARGDAYLGGGAYDWALASYRKAQDVAPGDAEVWRALGVVYTRLHRFPEAVAALRRSLALRPRRPQVLVELAFAEAQRDSLSQALATYRQAVDLDPREPSAYANLGLTYLTRGSLEDAIPALERAVALDPSLAAANFALASAYQRLGRAPDAITALERGLEFDPGNAAARRALGALAHGPGR
jgi:tetratricopeptide (TPR) repeat protein